MAPETQQIPVDPAARAGDPKADAARDDAVHEIAPDLACRRFAIVDVVFVGRPGSGGRGWVLVDAGIPETRAQFEKATARFDPGARPAAIVLTHGHFDPVGVPEDPARDWDAPAYARALEHPYVDCTA